MLLLTSVLAQLDLGLIASELPACSISCSEQVLPPAGCPLEDAQNCLCRNITMQSQLSICVQTSCNKTEQLVASSVAQNICKAVPQPSRSGDLIRAIIILSAFAFPIIILRIIARRMVAEIWWDDWAIIGAGIFMIPTSVMGIYNTTKGFGKHVWDVPPQDTATLQELYYVSQILYVIVKNLAKASILLLFLRIFPDQRFRLFTKICLIWIACNAFAFSMAVTLQCIPVDAVWDISTKGKCINSGAVVFAGAGLSIFEDIIIILLPVMELKSLPLSLRKKFAVIFIFALGSFACITSIIRLKYIVAYQIRSFDPTWDSTDVLIWSFVEDYTAVICSSLITIRPLLAKFMPWVFGSTLASQNHNNTFTTPHRMDSKSVGAFRDARNVSSIELEAAEGLKGMDEWGGSEEARSIEAWDTKSGELSDADRSGFS